ETVFAFTTEEVETDSPLVSYFSPGNGNTNVSVGISSFQIQFDEDVIAIEGGSMSLIEADTDEVVETISLTNASSYSSYQSIYFSSGILEPSTEYYITVGANSYEDVFGNGFEGISDKTVWSFTTEEGETDPPVITSLTPSHEGADVSISLSNLEITFDENVRILGGEIRLVETASGDVIRDNTYTEEAWFSNSRSLYVYGDLLNLPPRR
ncbi:MAG: Ig-like domain-containing protein, partial [Bacteroidota bacterium]